jgi:Holliday junction resolvase
MSRRKGSRIEREIVKLHHEYGIAAERVPLSGAAGGSFTGDLLIDGSTTAEVKSRAGGSGFKTLEKWKGNHSLLFLKRDRQPPLVLMDFDMYAELMKDGNRS